MPIEATLTARRVKEWVAARDLPASVAPPPPENLLRAAAHIGSGDAARASENWPAAARHYGEAVREDPSAFPIWVQYGHALKQLGDLSAATAAYSHALALAPAAPDTLLHLGHVLGQEGDLDSAMLLLAEALRLSPGFPLAARELECLGREHFLRRMAAAASAFGKGEISHGMRQVDAAIDLPWTVAGDAKGLAAEALRRARGGELDGAVATLRALLEEEPGDLVRRKAIRAAGAWRSALRREALQRSPGSKGIPVSLHFVAFGTTGRCNASCTHCPTGKPETAHVPRVPMPMPLFERIVGEMAELGLWVRNQISLGLFGDGLVDPFVVQRARFLRRALPGCTIVVPTNGAAYNPARHAPLMELVDAIALHVESIRPEVYDRLMAPLRAERTFPRHAALLRDLPGKVHVSVPLSRLNRDERGAMREHFMGQGAVAINFVPLSNRCAVDSSAFDRLAIAPLPIRCKPEEVADNLIVDCDGQVLICCNDFSRIEPVGDLSRESLASTLASPARSLVLEQFGSGRHSERETCSRCYGDVCGDA